MGFSSQAISVKSSINLSDINIDTDLDMGSKSIIGYTPTSDFPKFSIYQTEKGNLAYKKLSVEILNLPDIIQNSNLTPNIYQKLETYNTVLNDTLYPSLNPDRSYLIKLNSLMRVPTVSSTQYFKIKKVTEDSFSDEVIFNVASTSTYYDNTLYFEVFANDTIELWVKPTTTFYTDNFTLTIVGEIIKHY